MGAARGDSTGGVESVLLAFKDLDRGSGGSVNLGHRVTVIVGHPGVGTVRGDDRVDAVEVKPVPRPTQDLDKGAGGSVQFGHRLTGAGHPDVGAIGGDARQWADLVEPVACACELG